MNEIDEEVYKELVSRCWERTDDHPHFIIVTTRRKKDHSIKLIGNRGNFTFPYYGKKYSYPTRFKNKKSAERTLTKIKPFIKKGYKVKIESIYDILTKPIIRKLYPKLELKKAFNIRKTNGQ